MQEDWQRFRNEVSDPSLLGPTVIPYGEAEHIDGELSFTGYRLEMTTDTIEMSAPILRMKTFYANPLEDLFLMTENLGFSFFVYGHNVPYLNGAPLLRLTSALRELYHNTTCAYDVLQVLERLDVLLIKNSRGPARLHTSCADFASEKLRKLGFAINKISPHEDYIRVRMAWLFPSSRNGKAGCYVPAGTVKLRQKKGDIFDSVEFCEQTFESVCSVLQDRLFFETQGEVENLLSEKGKERVYDAFFWGKGVDSPRAKARKQKVRFVAEHKELWSNHELLAKALHESGLYSKTTVLSQIKSSCWRLVEEAKALGNKKEE